MDFIPFDQRQRSAPTLFAGIHGKVELHPWRDPATDVSDAYSLFVGRSSAMGWLANGHDDSGLWGMNDAKHNFDGTDPSTYALWFQVGLQQPLPLNKPLPVQQFLSCARDVIARLGTLQLDTLQIVLPDHKLNGLLDESSLRNAIFMLWGDKNWFDDCNPQSQTQVQITLDGGQNPSICTIAPKIFQRLQEVHQTMFTCNAYTLTDDSVQFDPFLITHLWSDPHHRVTFSGTLVEWSLDAIGWLVAFLSCISAQFGVNTPLAFSVKKTAL